MVKAIKLTPYELTESKYHIVAHFTNVGRTHFEPVACKATLTTPVSTVPRVSARLASEIRGTMQPFERREFQGVLNLATVEPGEYRLSAGLQFDRNEPWEQEQMRVRVSLVGERRIMEITGTQNELPEILEVQWGAPSAAN